MSTFVCARCQKVCGPFERIERRVEFRNARTQGREATYKESDICKGCMTAELEERRGPASRQGSLTP